MELASSLVLHLERMYFEAGSNSVNYPLRKWSPAPMVEVRKMWSVAECFGKSLNCTDSVR